MKLRRPFRRTRKRDYAVTLSQEERDVLRSLPGQLRELLGTDDPALYRLFPPAYGEEKDAELEDEYRRLMGDDLLDRHNAVLLALESTVDNERLTEDELMGWLGAINDLRLVLGTRLDVTEEMDPMSLDASDPRQPAFALYHYLTWLQDEAVTALSA